MSITYNKSLQVFMITTANTSYSFSKDSDGILTNLYWADRIARIEDLPIGEMHYPRIGGVKHHSERKIREEYPGWGGRYYNEPVLKATFSDGTRDVELRYVSHSISDNGNEMSIVLQDVHYPLEVILKYEIYDGLDIINKWCIVKNKGHDPILLESALSAAWYLPDLRSYRLTHLASCWGREYEISRLPLTQTRIELDSRTGISNSNQMPYFALDTDGKADEHQGEVWFGALQWSGNWKIVVEKDPLGCVQVTGGINDFDFSWRLNEDEEYQTPVFTAGYTCGGFGAASRMLHDYQKYYLNPRPWAEKPLPVVYNAWAAFEFSIDEKLMMDLAEKAASIGVELFVMDDGWFSTRDDSRSGLGDWQPSSKKFPNGLNPLIEKVNSLGMNFGLWVEPEMVNPDSDLYRHHPEWILNFPHRDRELHRNQCVLNLARSDVKEYIISFLDNILDNHNIYYLKWDMNRLFSQPGWPEESSADQKKMWVKYVHNFYAILDHLNNKYPDLIIENCASGGLRADLAMTRYCSRVNRSDNQDPLDMLKLHEGFTYINRSRTAGGGGHISASGSGVNGRHTSYRYKAHIAMMGSFAVGLDLRKCSAAELDDLSGWIKQHKLQRDTVQNGDLYRLASAWDKPYAIYEFVSHNLNQVVLMSYGQSMQFAQALPRIRLYGLDPQAQYKAEGYKIMSGEGLMHIGIRLQLKGDFDSRIIVWNKVES
ncbi:MAG: alpha-galactosidase [Bacillota bacterium]|nr:alpha-galactosidase [Bacillota bacterium]